MTKENIFEWINCKLNTMANMPESELETEYMDGVVDTIREMVLWLQHGDVMSSCSDTLH